MLGLSMYRCARRGAACPAGSAGPACRRSRPQRAVRASGACCRALTLSTTGGEGPTPTTGAGKVMFCGIAVTGLVLVAAYSERAAGGGWWGEAPAPGAPAAGAMHARCTEPAPPAPQHVSARPAVPRPLLQPPTWQSSCSSATPPS